MWKFSFYLLPLLAALVLLLGCGRKKASTKTSAIEETSLSDLRQKYSKYQSIVASSQDEHGFIDTDACDSLLFSALVGVGNLPISIESARNESGQWFRRPLNYEPCYPNNSASTISKDMMLGLFFYIWRLKRLDLAESLFAYGESRNWKMGEGDPTRVYLSPGLQATLAEIIFRLGGKNHYAYRSIPNFYSKDNRGYTVHLDTIHILLRGELLGYVNTDDLSLLKGHLDRNPRNGLIAFVYHKFTDGDQAQAVAILLDEFLFPSDRAPTTKDRKTDYLWQRELGPDWEPSEEEKPLNGADFYFLATLLLNGT